MVDLMAVLLINGRSHGCLVNQIEIQIDFS